MVFKRSVIIDCKKVRMLHLQVKKIGYFYFFYAEGVLLIELKYFK